MYFNFYYPLIPKKQANLQKIQQIIFFTFAGLGRYCRFYHNWFAFW